jgi:GNAT superfamily N-acetyltransferase
MAARSVTTWHLELLRREAFRPSTRPLRLRLERLVAPAPEFARFLYATVGEPYGWRDRLPWRGEQWLNRLADPAGELWVGYEEGAPAGYFELEIYRPTVEILYFGLFPHAIGRGHGGPLLSAAVERAWTLGGGRVYVHTCSLDHPSALPNYQARGFTIFREDSP